MAVNTNEIRIVTSQAERALANLQGSLGKLNNAFGGLKTAIAGLAIGSFVQQAYRMADAINDLSAATGISIMNIKGFQTAIKGSVDGSEAASAGLGRFAMAVEAAASGSKEMQDRFLKLGISLDDLRNLSEQDLLGRVVQQLGGMSAGSERAALGIGLFGKAFRSADWGQIANSIGKTTAESAASAAALKAAGDASDSVAAAIGKLQVATLIMLKPLSDFINSIGENEKAMRALVQTVTVLTASFVALTIAGKIFAVFKGAIIIIDSLAASFIAATASASGFALVMSRLLGWVSLVIAGFTALDYGIKVLTGTSLVDWIKEAVGWSDDLGKATTDNATALNDQAKASQNAAREVVDAMAKQKEAIRAIVTAYQDANKAANERYQSETNLVGASERQKLAVQELNAAYDRYMQQFTKMRDEYEKLRVGTDSEKKAAQELYPEFAKLSEAYLKQKDAIAVMTEARAKANEQYQLELFNTKSMIDSQNKLMDIQDEIAKSTMTEIEKKYYDIDRAAQRSAKAAIEAEEARRGAPLDSQEVQAYYDAATRGTEQLKRATQGQYEQSRQFATGWKQAFNTYAEEATNAAKIAQTIFNKTMTGLEDLIVNFTKTGKFEWKQFASSMLEELLRIQLRQTFAGILGGITDLFGGGDTGQGRGASANNPVYVADVSSGLGGFGAMGAYGQGGITGSMGNYLGSGMMGSLATGRGSPGGISSLWNTVSDFFGNQPYETTKAPDNWYAATQAENFYEPWKNQPQQQSGGLWDSITQGVSDLFSGWFANGGNIPAGTFGVVGERGPELVSGPANVTPMTGGTNVTYYINAVDAMSFKQLVAQDPGFIHAVAMQGASSVPGRR